MKTTSSSSSRRRTTNGATRRRGGGGGVTTAATKTHGTARSLPTASAEAMHIMRELAESRQETIRAKDQLIQILMSRSAANI